jgi:hypothetical protein
MRQPTPDAIERKMKLWRNGLAPLPQEYIEWHRQLATEAKSQLANYRILMQGMIDDGWGDGMKFLALTIVHKATGKLSVIKWSDSQCWLKRFHSGGWGIFRPDATPNQEGKKLHDYATSLPPCR